MFLKNIEPDKISSWDRIFLTFDMDWAHDEVIIDTLELLKKGNINCTFFITHKTSLIDEIRNVDNIEIGLHPNFNNLLNGDSKNYSADHILNNLMDIAPESKSIRSHSIVNSSRLTNLFLKLGITHESNIYIPYWTNINLSPWKSESGIVHCPYFFADELACLPSKEVNLKTLTKISTQNSLRIFDFHPIHVFLNTESLDRYESTREMHFNPKELIKHRYKGYGTRDRLQDLIDNYY